MKYEVVFSDNSSTTIIIDKKKGDKIYSGDDGIICVHAHDDHLIFAAPIISVKYIKACEQ